jgi:acyl-CoA thioester hydrolase
MDPPTFRPQMTRFTIDVQMRFRDVDGMGHVNNAVFLSYMELARTHFYLKYANKRSLEEIDFILAHVDIDYETPAEWGDEIQVSVWPSRIGTTSFVLSYEITEKRSGRVIAWAKSVLVSYDYSNRRTKPIPTEFRRVLEANLEPAA